MDTVDFGYIFAFTAIDIYAKDVAVKLYPSLTSTDGADFLVHAFKTRYGHTELIQTDGGSEFKGQFKQLVQHYADRYRVARPYKKNEQAFIESFNRSLRKECLGWGSYKQSDLPDLTKELNDYLTYYHEKKVHLSLQMKTPHAILQEYQLVSDI